MESGELMIYEFLLGLNTVETTKNFSWTTGEDIADHSIETRECKKFR